MLAEMANGVARALSNGQTESQGEYEAKSILITGGAGFIASHVVIRLVQRYPEAKVSRSAVLIGNRCASKDSLVWWLLKLPNEARNTKQLWVRASCSEVLGTLELQPTAVACTVN